MQTNFDKCLGYVLEHEGGYVDHPEDPGGRTNRGITQKVYEKYLDRPVTEKEMKELPLEHAQAIYKKNYWDKVCGDDLPDGLDFSVFDWAVNSGPSRAAKVLFLTLSAPLPPAGAVAVPDIELSIFVILSSNVSQSSFFEKGCLLFIEDTVFSTLSASHFFFPFQHHPNKPG